MRVCLLIGLQMLIFVGSLSAQGLTARGREFWLCFADNGFQEQVNTGDKISVFISSRANTSGRIEAPLDGWGRNFTVTAGTPTEIQVPIRIAMDATSDGTLGRGIVVRTQDSVNVYALNYKLNSADASVVLPKHVLRDDYVVMSYNEQGPNASVGLSQFNIVGIENNTEIEIIPSSGIRDGANAGQRFTIRLNAGQVYQAQGREIGVNDLTGTVIRSATGSCKPFAVFGGNRCSNVGDCGRCDHLFEQVFPVSTWGLEYIFVPLRNRTTGDVIRVLAAENNTQVAFSDGTRFMLQAGSYRDFRYENSIHIQADKPIMVSQFSVGGCCDAGLNTRDCGGQPGNFVYGDPFMLLVSPLEQMTIRNTTVNNFDLFNIDDSFINVITPTSAVSTFRIDGQAVDREFRAVPGKPEYSYARLPVTKGDHTLTSGVGFIVYVYGFGTRDSYGYSGDITLSNLRLRIEGPVTACTGQAVGFKGESSRQVSGWQWRTSDGQTRTGQETNFTFARAGTYYVTLVVQDASTNCGVDSSVHEINVFGPELVVEERKAPSCGRRDGVIRVSARNGQPPYRYRINGGQPQQSGVFQNLSSGRYTITLEDNSQCTNQMVIDLLTETDMRIEVISKTDATCLRRGQITVRATSPNGSSVTYRWSTGATGPTVSDLVAGTYSVTAVDSDGCEAVLDSIVIRQTQELTAQIRSLDPLPLCPGQRVRLQSNNQPGLSFQWFMNGEPIANGTSAMIQVSQAGSYTVRVSVGDCQSVSPALEVAMGQAPPAQITASKPVEDSTRVFLCANESVILSAARREGFTYQWFKDGQNLNRSEVSITVDQPGTYWVVVSNGSCTAQSRVLQLIRVALPNVAVRVEGDLALCAGSSVVFSVEPEENVSYRWTRNGQNISGAEAPTFTASQPGNYQLVAVRAGCEARSEVFSVTQTNLQKPRITTPENRLTACQGDTVILNAVVAEGARMQWLRDGQPIDGATLNRYATSVSGSYVIRVSASNCSQDSDPATVTIVPNEITPILAPVPAEFCEGASLTLATAARAGARYRWTRDGQVLRATDEPQLEINLPGSWRVQYFAPVTASSFCYAPSEPVEVIVRSRPSGRILSLTDRHNLCDGYTLKLDAVQSGAQKYTWFRNGQLVSEGANSSFSVTEGGRYRLTVFDGFCSSEDGNEIEVRLFASPQAIVDPAGPLELCSGQSIDLRSAGVNPPGTRYEWRRDGLAISGANFPQLSLNQVGSYTLIASLIHDIDDSNERLICQTTSEPVSVIPARLTSARISSVNSVITCQGNKVEFFTDSLTDARYQWFRDREEIAGANASRFTATQPGFYYVQVSLGPCESRSSTLPAVFLPRPQIGEIVAQPATCAGKANGLAAIDVNGGSRPYRYLWSNGATELLAKDLFGGYYSVTVTDQRGCTAIADSIHIAQPEPLTITVDSTKAAICPTSPDGSIYVSVRGGVEPYSWLWSNGARSQSLIGVTGGSYSLMLTDANNCVAVKNSIRLDHPEAITPVLTQLVNNRCFGDSTGVVAFTAFGGTAPFEYSRDGQNWDQVANYTGLRGRNNLFYIRDSRGCVHEFDSGLRDPDSLHLKVYKTNETCPNSANGNITLEGKGGIAPYTYYLNQFKNYHGIYPFLAPAKYVAKVVDKNGCVFTADTLLIEPATGTQVESDFIGVGGANVENGACATLTQGGQSFQNSAVWNRQLINLNSGFDLSFNVEFDADDQGADGVVFALQSIGPDALGVAGQGMGYERMPNSVGIEFDIFQNGSEPACDHTAISLNGNITEPVAGPTPVSASQCSVKDGLPHQVRVTWSPATRTLEVYFDGDLRLTHQLDLIGSAFRGNPNVWWGFTGATGGQSTRQRVCMQNTQVVCDCQPFTPIVQTTGYYEICQGQKVTFTAPPGYASYLWSNGERTQSIDANVTDTYYVSVGDSAGCGGSSAVSTVIVHPKPELTNVLVNQIFGDGFTGLIDATAAGGVPPYTFSLTSDEVNLSQSTGYFPDLQAGVHTLTVTDQNGCLDFRVILIEEPFVFCKNPNKLRVENVTETSATVSWEKPKNNATGYIVSLYNVRDGVWREQTVTDADRTSFTLFDLTPGFSYRVRVRTVCGDRFSLFSPDSSFTTPKACPRPVDVNIVPGPYAIDVSWRETQDALSYKIGWKLTGSDGGWFEATVSASRPSYRILGLDPMTDVQIRIRTVCRLDDASVWSGPFDTKTTDPDACLPPATTLLTNLSNRSARIEWEAVPRAQQYEVSLRPKGAGDGEWQVNLTRNNGWDWLDLAPNTLYEYRVRTMCSVVKFSDYLPVREFRTVNRNCVQPTDLQIAAKLTTADLSWSVNSDVQGFEVSWRRIDAPGNWLRVTINSATTLNYRVSNLLPETAYEFRVQAICAENALGEPARDTASTLPASVCPAPDGLSLEQVGSNQLRVSWQPVVPALRYRLGYALLSQTQWTFQEVTQTSVLLGGLQPLGIYRVQLQCLCAEGIVSLPTATDTVQLVSGNCLPPQISKVISGTDRIGIEWQAAQGATAYVVRWRLFGSAGNWNEQRVDNPLTRSHTVTGLIPGTLYEIRLLTQCPGEFSTWADSTLSTLYDESGVGCANPANAVVVDLADFSAVLQWAPMPNAVYYEVQWRPATAPSWNVETTTGTRFELTGLQPNRLYSYQIRTYCTEGRRSAWTATRSFRTTIECPSPKNITIVTGSRSVVLSWDHVLQARGYRVLWRPRQAATNWDVAEVGSQTSNSIQLTSLQSNTEYEFRVVSLCDALESPFTEGRFTTGSGSEPVFCAAPSGLRQVSILRDRASYAWNASQGALEYEVQVRALTQSLWSSQFSSVPQTEITGLTASTSYAVRVRSRCASGSNSAFTSVDTFMTSGPCSIPTNLRLARAFNNRLVVSWNLMLEATGYAVSWRLTGAFNNWATATVNSATTNSHTIQNLLSGRNYEVRVQAICGVERSSWSQPISVSTLTAREESLADGTETPEAFVYPNPNRGRFQVELAGFGEGPVSFEIYDLQGRLLNRWEEADSERFTFDLDGVSAGIYVLSIRSATAQAQHKLMIE